MTRLTVLVDGPSGSGKTTFATALGERTGLRVVHLDDFYPGWSGLAEASRMVVDDVLHPTRPGYRRWEWVADAPGEWVALDPGCSLIVEGVGAVTAASISAAEELGEVLSVRIDAPWTSAAPVPCGVTPAMRSSGTCGRRRRLSSTPRTGMCRWILR